MKYVNKNIYVFINFSLHLFLLCYNTYINLKKKGGFKMNENYENYENYETSATPITKSNYAFGYVFLWMFFGILVTGGVSWLVSASPLLTAVAWSWPAIIISAIVQIVIALSLGKATLLKLNKPLAIGLYFVYAALNGLTFGILFYMLDASELFAIFGVTAGFFALMCIFAFIFKDSLRRASRFFMIGLTSLLIMSLVSLIFWYSNPLLLAVSIIGLLVFGGLTAFDVRWIKDAMDNSDNPSGIAIYGAFHLYLDFINIFMYIVRIYLLSNKD